MFTAEGHAGSRTRRAQGIQLCNPHINMVADIPEISLTSSDGDELIERLRRACKEHGFFIVRDHGLAPEEIESVMQESRRFFDLPMTTKVACAANSFNRGYTRFGDQMLDPEKQTTGDTKEGFYMGREPEPHEVGKFALLGPNRWPDADAAPSFRPAIESYLEKMSEVGKKVVRLLALALELPGDYFDASFSAPMTTVRLLHYSNQLSKPERGIFAAGEHSDFGMITLLLTDGEPGLQVKIQGQWVGVSAPRECFICNLGDMLERWSNLTFHSTKHRVVNTTGRTRYSIPLFFEPNFDTIVTPVPTCGEPKFKPIKSGDYLLQRILDVSRDPEIPAE